MSNDLFEGSFFRKNVKRTPDFWSSEPFELGKRSDDDQYFTGFRAYIKEPTVEYPDAGVFLQMYNSRSKIFCRTYPNDLRGLAHTLNNWADQIEEQAVDLAPKCEAMQVLNQAASVAESQKGDNFGENNLENIAQQLQYFQAAISQAGLQNGPLLPDLFPTSQPKPELPDMPETRHIPSNKRSAKKNITQDDVPPTQ